MFETITHVLRHYCQSGVNSKICNSNITIYVSFIVYYHRVVSDQIPLY